MPIPPAFINEPFASFSVGRHLFQHEVLAILGITADEFAALRLAGYLRPIGSPCLPQYNRKKVVAFAYGLATNARLAEATAFIIDRYAPNWAAGDDVNPDNGMPANDNE
jgi:hypothetical protein